MFVLFAFVEQNQQVFKTKWFSEKPFAIFALFCFRLLFLLSFALRRNVPFQQTSMQINAKLTQKFANLATDAKPRLHFPL